MSTKWILSILIAVPLGPSAQAAEGSELLDKRLPALKISVDNAFVDFCRSLESPCGWEKLPQRTPTAAENETLSIPKGARVREALDQIASRYPDYTLRIEDDVIDMIPKASAQIASGYPSPLDKQVKPLELSVDRPSICATLIAEAGGMQPGPKNYVIDMIGISKLRSRPIHLKIGHSSVRSALNAVVYADQHSMWIFTPIRGRPESTWEWLLSFYASHLGLRIPTGKPKWSASSIKIVEWPKDH